MPPSSQSKIIISNDNQERINDLSHHSELPSFELEAIHEALDHAFDHYIEQDDEKIKEINRQTRVHEKLIADVSSYKGRLQSIPNKAVKNILKPDTQPTKKIPTLVRESLEEAITDKQKDNNRHQHHKFTERHSLNSSTSVDEKKDDAISSTTNAEKKKILMLIILLSLTVIILGIVIITH